ncbi:TDP-N-acetylfucosamine:lipid II N-acetylfucosaminyltransferase [Salinimicrobium sp. WS361]|uniref:TDP-N-acetylfucosamine:lipid II N-acetylfucosaminyltransferase n=1 Tax=Salinimicrobium sp. WS361 TaxID=3425123 RepID=UPI003D6F6E73
MNLHLLQDSPFYADYFMDRVKKLNIKGQKFVYLNKDKPLQYIKSEGVLRMGLDDDIQDFLQRNKIDRVYIHNLTNTSMKFLDLLPNNIEIYWFFWGWDGYRHPKMKKQLYLPSTVDFLKKRNTRSSLLLKWYEFRNFLFEIKLNKALRKIDYCCNQVQGDFDLIKNLSHKFKMKHVFFAYSGINQNFQKISVEKYSNNALKILLGNSANPTNNHIDILIKLKPYSNHISEIICPLSYSGKQDYIEEVIRVGTTLFGSKFIPLRKFLPLDDYKEILRTVDVGIFYHIRQQAYSNTIGLLEYRKRVLLHPKSTLYKMYSDFKVQNVFCNLDRLLKTDEMIHDNSLLYDRLSEEAIDYYYYSVLT